MSDVLMMLEITILVNITILGYYEFRVRPVMGMTIPIKLEGDPLTLSIASNPR